MNDPDRAPRSGRVITRRSLIKLSLFAAVPALVPGIAWAALRVRRHHHAHHQSLVRSLSFDNLHTGERLSAVYYRDGHYVPAGLEEIDYILRDFRLDEVKAMDPKLLDLLVALRSRLRTRSPFEVISGYRSPLTNAMLHATTEGVSPHSLHMQGRAIDIHVPGRSLGTLRMAALSLHRGGVGYYPHSNFVHVDTGRVRWWIG